MSTLHQPDFPILHLLGLESDDIQNICKTDVGLQLLQWLDTQNSTVTPRGNGAGENDSQTSSLWQEIALEEDEVPLSLINHNALEPQAQDLSSNSYFPPSKAKARVDLLNEENALIQREVDLLKARLSTLKGASKKVNQSTKALQRSVKALDPRVRTFEERTTELSVEADRILESTTSKARDLLFDLGYPSSQEGSHLKCNGHRTVEPVDLDVIKDVLVGTQAELSGVGMNLRQKLEAIDRIREIGVEKAEDIQRETARLQMALGTVTSQSDESVYERHLQGICDVLERAAAGNDTHVLGNLLAEAGEQKEFESLSVFRPLDVAGVLRMAWANDQALILHQEENALDETMFSLNSILEPLDNLQPSLGRMVAAVQEAEALLEAYGEELEDIQLPNSVFAESQRHSTEREDNLVELEIRRVLAQFENSRKPNATPLLVLTREDILSELRDFHANQKMSEDTERKQATDLTNQVIARPLHPSIPYIYANSAVYTSPPFSQLTHAQALQKKAEQTGSELRDLAATLEIDVRDEFGKSGTIGRLGSFVEKWTN